MILKLFLITLIISITHAFWFDEHVTVSPEELDQAALNVLEHQIMMFMFAIRYKDEDQIWRLMKPNATSDNTNQLIEKFGNQKYAVAKATMKGQLEINGIVHFGARDGEEGFVKELKLLRNENSRTNWAIVKMESSNQ